MNTRIPTRRGFTLIELLVAIGIISLLIALILPAVQMARESARKMQCRNNLKQLALALHQYHDAFQAFPLNYGHGPYTDQNTGASWLQQILPFVDQAHLQGKLRFGRPLSDPENTAVAQTSVPLFLCPSDSSNGGRMSFRSNVSSGTWAVQNYKACAGSNWNWGLFAPVTSSAGRNAHNPDGLDHCNGLICRGGDNRPTMTRLAHVRDGTSHTFGLGESVPEWCRHTWWYWFNDRWEQLAVHARAEPGRFRTDTRHIPMEKVSAVERGTDALLRQVSAIGQHAEQWSAAMVQTRGVEGVRVLVGLKALAAKHDPAAIDRACQTALAHGAYRLRTIRTSSSSTSWPSIR